MAFFKTGNSGGDGPEDFYQIKAEVKKVEAQIKVN